MNTQRFLPLLALLVAAAGAPALEPTPGRIAVVPVVNLTGERNESLKQRQNTKFDEYVRKELTKRRFDVLSDREVREAIRDAEIDFTDEEQQKRAVLFDLGEKVNADYILLPVLTRTEQKQQDRNLYTDTEGTAELKIWLLDIRAKRAILSARTFVGRSGGARINLRPSDRQVQAAANAARDALKLFFQSEG